MKKLVKPLLTVVLGILFGVGTGLFMFYRAAETALAHAVPAAPKKELVSEEERERGWNFWTIEIENLSNELKGERERLLRESEELERRQAQFASEGQELNKVRAEIERLRQEIATKVIEINADEVKNIRMLAQTYTNLTPRAAVAIIREMDDVITVKILSVMKPDVVAPIFEELSRTPDKDGSLARRAAILSDRLRLMKTAKAASTP